MFSKTCPNCNYNFSIKTILFKKRSDKLVCPKCKSTLVASIKSKFIFSIIMLITFILWVTFTDSYLSSMPSSIKYLLAFILFFLLFFIIEPLVYKFEIYKDLSKTKK